jgi:hypothetical protein
LGFYMINFQAPVYAEDMFFTFFCMAFFKLYTKLK